MRHPLLLLLLWTALVVCGGYFWPHPLAPEPAEVPASACRGDYPPVGLKLPSPWNYRPGSLKAPTPSHNYVMPPWIPLNSEQRQMVATSPAEMREKVWKGVRPFKHKLCREATREVAPGAAEELCSKVSAIGVESQVKRNLAYRGFLARGFDQDHFQDDVHRAMVEEQVRLEQLLDYTQTFAYNGVRHGNDPFLYMTRFGDGLPPNFKLGDDLISGDAAGEEPAPPGGTLPPVEDSDKSTEPKKGDE